MTDGTVNSDVFAKNTVLSVFAKVAFVNVETGKFEFVMRKPEYVDDAHADSPDIYTYIRRQVNDQTVYPEHAGEYLRYSDREYVKKRISEGTGRSVISYRRKTASGSMWMTFSVIAAAEEYSEENPYVLFTWREADNDTTTMLDAVSVLSSFYYKILRINITTDTYEIVKPDQNEEKYLSSSGTPKPETISGWLRQFVDNGFVDENDADAYRDFTDIKRLSESFKSNRAVHSLRYRRQTPQGFRWSQMYLMTSVEYTDDNQMLTLYVRDVHEDHIATLRDKDKMTKIMERDALTLLYNRNKYQKDLVGEFGGNVKYGEDAAKKIITIAYIDVNGLHEVNNNLGHDAGDNMLCSVADALKKYFPDDRCYRIGGDEFVMISDRLSEDTVKTTFEEVRKELLRDSYEIALGIASGSVLNNETVIGAAELRMREDKAEYYKRHGDRRKREQMNEELEKILTEKKEEEFFLKIIARRFAGVYFVNLDKTESNVRQIFAPNYFINLLTENNYRYQQSLKQYAKMYVKSEYQDLFEEMLDFGPLKSRLKNGEDVSYEYEKSNGQTMHIHIIKQEDDNGWDDHSSLWIFEEGKLDSMP